VKLLLKKLDALLDRAWHRQAREPMGIAWVTDWPKAEPGADLVEDVHVHREGVIDEWTLTARAARDPGDLGDVYDAGGAIIGRVTKREKTLLEWEPLEGTRKKAAP
jgi:hypothetical protein